MKLKAVPTQTDYAVELTREQYDRLNEFDFIEDGVYATFKALGVDDRTIEFNGHFGSYFYFSLSVEQKLEPVLEALEKLVSPPAKVKKSLIDAKSVADRIAKETGIKFKLQGDTFIAKFKNSSHFDFGDDQIEASKTIEAIPQEGDDDCLRYHVKAGSYTTKNVCILVYSDCEIHVNVGE